MASATYIVKDGRLVEVDVVDGKVVEVTTIRCPECGAKVKDPFEHVALERCPEDA